MIYEIAQGVVFRRHETGIHFLVLKRAPDDGGFWQAITGTIEDGELALELLKYDGNKVTMQLISDYAMRQV
jgi:hypothetical protein